MSEAAVASTVALTVHGPFGAVDLVVPLAAAAGDVAREYAVQCRLQRLPALFTTTGTALAPSTSIARAGIRSGAVLVAHLGGPPTVGSGPRALAGADDRAEPGRGVPGVVAAALALGIAAVAATLAAVLGAHAGSESQRDATLALLALCAAVGVLPIGRFVDQRGIAAPAFGAAVAWVLAWDPSPETAPLTLGLAGLGAAVVAAVARATGAGSVVVHTVWMAAGITTFLVTGVGVLAGFPPQVAWAALLVVALLSTRSATALAVDVPDRMLLDIDRLAVTAWSARDRPVDDSADQSAALIRGAGIAATLARGSRIVDAASVAILVVTVTATLQLMATATYDVDRQGAQCLVLFTGAGLLLAARGLRHVTARMMLRGAGLFAWAVLVWHLLPDLSERSLAYVVLGCLGVAATAGLAAVATGRGWRSARWAGRAELAEIIVGALAIGASVVASGLFRIIWEIPFSR
ncbi:hypothetical protein [Nocardioides jensenii]|uniref:hypothetical protein n=1 Tax=Nocardioides jensenii TaxID=1843 RepID=UPI00083302D5|nr:hypothetical protein [Nocardioides jensenii]